MEIKPEDRHRIGGGLVAGRVNYPSKNAALAFRPFPASRVDKKQKERY